MENGWKVWGTIHQSWSMAKLSVYPGKQKARKNCGTLLLLALQLGKAQKVCGNM